MTPEQWQREACDLLFYVEKGYLVVQTPAESESWHWRKRILDALSARENPGARLATAENGREQRA